MFEVDTQELLLAGASLSECSSELYRAMLMLNQDAELLRSVMNDQPNLSKAINDVTQQMNVLSSRVGDLGDSLDTIARVYQRTEDNVRDQQFDVRLDVNRNDHGDRFVIREADPEVLARFRHRYDNDGPHFVFGPQLFRGAREGPLQLAGELFTAATRPLG